MNMTNTLPVGDCWGVSSLRQHAGFPFRGRYVAPIGTCLVQWDMTNHKCQGESTSSQIHQDLVTVMVQNFSEEVLTVGFGGEVKIWKGEEWDLMVSFQSPTDNVIHGSWSLDGNAFSLCSKGPRQKLLVYSMNRDIENHTQNPSVIEKWSFPAPQQLENTVDVQENKRKIYPCFNASIFKSNGELLAVYQTKDVCELFLFSAEGELLKRSAIAPLGESKNDMQCISSVYNDTTVAVGVQRGIFGFYDVRSLELIAVIQSTGSPRICLWDGDLFVTMSYVSGVMSFWDSNGVLLKEVSGMVIMHYLFMCLCLFIFTFNYALLGSRSYYLTLFISFSAVS